MGESGGGIDRDGFHKWFLRNGVKQFPGTRKTSRMHLAGRSSGSPKLNPEDHVNQPEGIWQIEMFSATRRRHL